MPLTGCNPKVDVAFGYSDSVTCNERNNAVVEPLGDDTDADQLNQSVDLSFVFVEDESLPC